MTDFIVIPLLLIVIYIIAHSIQLKHIEEHSYYRYFKKALFVKIAAGIVFAFIYMFYYNGGDTQYYFTGTRSVVRMMNVSFPSFIKIMGGDNSAEMLSMFNKYTGWPTYFKDANSFSVCRFNILFYLLSFGSFFGNTIVMNFFLFIGLWQFYKMLVRMYPAQEKWMAYVVFFIPSVVFWSSGLLKDAWSLTAILLLIRYFYNLIICRQFKITTLLLMLFWGYVLFSIRPFMMYAVLASGLIWLGMENISRVKSKFLRIMVLPIVIGIIFLIGRSAISELGEAAGGRYEDIDSMLETAWIIQDDLKKDYYGGQSFDIGYFEPTIAGVIKLAPKAIVAGLFRPFLWEARSPFMLVSGLENFVLLLAFILLIIRYRKYHFFRTIIKTPFLLSIFVLAIIFSFAIGLTISNFGAMVRYVIPATLLMGVVLVRSYGIVKKSLESDD